MRSNDAEAREKGKLSRPIGLAVRRGWWAKSLHAQLTLGFIAAAMIPMVSLAVLTSRSAEQALRENIHLLLTLRAERMVQSLDNSIRETRVSLSQWARLSLMYDLIADDPDGRVSGTLRTLAAQPAAVNRLFALSPNGTVTAASEPNLIGKRFGEQPWFRAVMDQGDARGDPPFRMHRGTYGGRIEYYLIEPVKLGSASSLIGFLVAVVQPDQVMAYVRDLERQEKEKEKEKDASLAFHLTRWGGQQIESPGQDGPPTADSDRNAERRMLPQGWDDQVHVVSYARSAETGSEVAAIQTQEEAYVPIYGLRGQVLLLGVALLGLVFPLSALMATSWSRPLRSLTATADRLAGGEFRATGLPVDRWDEIGTLARSFRHMTEGLRDLTEGLEQRVAERTVALKETQAELIRLNGTLEQQVAERTREVFEGRQRLQAILDGTSDAVFVKDLHGRYLLINRAVEQYVGKEAADVLGCDDTRIFPSADAQALMEGDQQILAGGKTVTKEEQVTTADEVYRTFLSTKGPLIDSQGTVTGLFGISRDITERKRTEELLEQRVAERTAALRESESRLRFVTDHAPVCLAQLDRDCRYKFVNRPYASLFGLDPTAFPGRHAKDVTGEAAHAQAESHMTAVLSGQPVMYDLEWPGSAGMDSGTLNVRYAPEIDESGAVIGFIAAIADITARKEAEAAKHRLASIVESSDDAIIGKTLDGLITSWNRSAERLLGYTETEMLGRSIRAILPEDRQAEENQILAKLNRGERIEHFETVRRRKDGTLIDVAILISPIKDETGAVVGASKIMRDIGARKQAEAALAESEARLRLFIEHAPAALAMFDEQMQYLAVSRRWMTDYGLGASDIVGRSHYEVFPEIPERWTQVHRRVLAGETVLDDEDRFDRADGSIQWLRWEAHPWRRSSGEVGGIVIFSEDITQLKRAEVKFKSLLEAAPDALVIVDQEGRITLVNQQAERVFGYQRAELIGHSIDILLPERFRAQHPGHRAKYVVAPHARSMGSGLDLWGRHKGGHEFPVEISLSPIETDEGTLVTAAVRDITERKKAFAALQQAHLRLQTLSREVGLAEERARGWLSRELHDEFGQLLSALKFDVKMLTAGLVRRRGLTAVAKQRMTAISVTVDRLFTALHAMVGGLRPAVLAKLGLVAAIENLIEEAEMRFRLRCRLTVTDVDDHPALGAELEATLYRMSQEMLTNVVRHAKASEVKIHLEKQKDLVRLVVEDDGVGFAVAAATAADRHGFRGIRERAELLGGTVAVRSRPDKGTRISVTIPLRGEGSQTAGIDTVWQLFEHAPHEEDPV